MLGYNQRNPAACKGKNLDSLRFYRRKKPERISEDAQNQSGENRHIDFLASGENRHLAEAQAISEAVLDAEVKIGELMAKVPKAQGKRTDIEPVDSGVHKSKADIIEDAGFTVKQIQRFETLAAHPEIVEQAKAEARPFCPFGQNGRRRGNHRRNGK